jgi:hypothetical protein
MSSPSELSLEQQLHIKERKESAPNRFPPTKWAAHRKACEKGGYGEPFNEFPWILGGCLPTPTAAQEFAHLSEPPRVLWVKTLPKPHQRNDPSWKERELEVCVVNVHALHYMMEKMGDDDYYTTSETVLFNGRPRLAVGLFRK